MKFSPLFFLKDISNSYLPSFSEITSVRKKAAEAI